MDDSEIEKRRSQLTELQSGDKGLAFPAAKACVLAAMGWLRKKAIIDPGIATEAEGSGWTEEGGQKLTGPTGGRQRRRRRGSEGGRRRGRWLAAAATEAHRRLAAAARCHG